MRSTERKRDKLRSDKIRRDKAERLGRETEIKKDRGKEGQKE